MPMLYVCLDYGDSQKGKYWNADEKLQIVLWLCWMWGNCRGLFFWLDISDRVEMPI